MTRKIYSVKLLVKKLSYYRIKVKTINIIYYFKVITNSGIWEGNYERKDYIYIKIC